MPVRAARLPVIQLLEGSIVRVPSHINMGGARQIARLKRVRCLLVSEGQRILGLLSADDWNRAPDSDPIWKWMGRSMGEVRPDTEARDALATMARQGTSFLIVSAGALVLGVVTEGRLRQAVGGTPPAAAAALVPERGHDDAEAELPWAAAG